MWVYYKARFAYENSVKKYCFPQTPPPKKKTAELIQVKITWCKKTEHATLDLIKNVRSLPEERLHPCSSCGEVPGTGPHVEQSGP